MLFGKNRKRTENSQILHFSASKLRMNYMFQMLSVTEIWLLVGNKRVLTSNANEEL